MGSKKDTEEDTLQEGEICYNFIDPEDFIFAENIVLDLHDLVGILLYEYQQSKTRFRHSKLLAVGDSSTLPIRPFHELPMWLSIKSRSKVGYFIGDPQETPPKGTPPVGPEDFLHPTFRSLKALDEEEAESIYWRIKLTSAQADLVYAMQSILDTLPASTILRIRTSQGVSSKCPANAFEIFKPILCPKKGMYIGLVKPSIIDSWTIPRWRTTIKHHYLHDYHAGDERSKLDWMILAFPIENSEEDAIILDLTSLVFGSRGLGGEIFSLEAGDTYINKVLDGVAKVKEDSDLDFSSRIGRRVPDDPSIEGLKELGQEISLTKRVLERLERICLGKEVFCSYCGKPRVSYRCSMCASSTYCGVTCQKKAWKYHKV